MIYEELPGIMVYADFAPGSWLLHFARAPWPVWAEAAEMRRVSAFHWGMQWYWWQKHRGLLEPSADLPLWLERSLVPDRLYRATEVMRALVQAGCPNEMMEDGLFSQRLQLMARWNGWTDAVSGQAYLEGRHHEHRPVPTGLPVFSGESTDAFVAHSHFAQLLDFLDWSTVYTLEELQIQVRQCFAGAYLVPLLQKVAETWAHPRGLQAAQWVLALHLEVERSWGEPRTNCHRVIE